MLSNWPSGCVPWGLSLQPREALDFNGLANSPPVSGTHRSKWETLVGQRLNGRLSHADPQQRIHRTMHRRAAALQHMGVNLRRGHILMAHQFLHRADVIPRLQQMGRETVAKRVRRRPLGDPRAQHRTTHRCPEPATSRTP